MWASIDVVFARGTSHTCAAQIGARGLEWTAVEVRQLFFLKGIRFRSYADVGDELGVGSSRAYEKHRDLCSAYGLAHEVDEDEGTFVYHGKIAIFTPPGWIPEDSK